MGFGNGKFAFSKEVKGVLIKKALCSVTKEEFDNNRRYYELISPEIIKQLCDVLFRKIQIQVTDEMPKSNSETACDEKTDWNITPKSVNHAPNFDPRAVARTIAKGAKQRKIPSLELPELPEIPQITSPFDRYTNHVPKTYIRVNDDREQK